MKRSSYTSAGIVVIIAIALVFVVVAFMTISGPLVGKVFSTINAPLSYAGAPPAVGGGALGEESARDAHLTGGNVLDTTATGATEAKRLVIKNADLTIVVKDPAAKMQAISTLAETMGGFVVSSNMGETYASNGTKVPQGSIVVRIPAEKLDDALKEIKTGVVEIQSETRSGQDVTKEYTDLQSQLKNLEATEQQLTLIMQKAEKTEDVLAVFNQLTQIRGQIEVTKGQIQYYEQSAALSAVNVSLVAEQTIQPIKIAGWEPQGVARDSIQSLVDFSQAFVNFLIRLVLFVIPALLLVLLPFYLIFLAIRAFLRRRETKKPAA